MQTHYLLTLAALLAAMFLGSCDQSRADTHAVDAPPQAIIPLTTQQTFTSASKPAKINQVAFSPSTATSLQEQFADLPTLLGLASERQGTNAHADLQLTLQLAELPDEAYELEVLHLDGGNAIQAHVAGGSEAGVFYGLQTLRQLLDLNGGALPALRVSDAPRYAYRGMMLDIARHFHGPAEIRRLIDLMSQYKLNVLHLHLADDQGWRIEIKSWPELTRRGASTQVGGGGGGFLTQQEYSDLVAYAKTRHITIVPEIDMPGHTNAALASYPELNCDGQAPAPYEGTEVGFSSLCIGKPITQKFVREVLTELAGLTPGPYLHIGGDESHATDSLDYREFMQETVEVVRSLGKTPIGWDEIAQASADPAIVPQYWASAENAAQAVANGQRVIMSPAAHAYLDMQYDSTSRIGLHWAGYTTVQDAYSYAPDSLVAGLTDQHILGLEAPLWTETVATRADIDYLVFPRLIAHAELCWSTGAARHWPDFAERLAKHGPRLRAEGVGFYESEEVDWQ